MANTVQSMKVAIGQVVNIACDGLQVRCTVKDVKNSWGKNRLLVSPVAGEGEVWVEMSRVSSPACDVRTSVAGMAVQTL